MFILFFSNTHVLMTDHNAIEQTTVICQGLSVFRMAKWVAILGQFRERKNLKFVTILTHPSLFTAGLLVTSL